MRRSVSAFCLSALAFHEEQVMIESLSTSRSLIMDDSVTSDSSSSRYGVDVSFPMHHENVRVNYDFLPHNALPSLYPTPEALRDTAIQPLGNRKAVYEKYVQGCVDRYATESRKCWEYEQDRVAMNLRQPQSMINYTETGFQKMSVPSSVWNPIREFWERNKENWRPERWPEGNTFVNHWRAPTYLVNIEDSILRGGGVQLKKSVLDGTRSAMMAWTGCEELTDSSLYGIRVYTEGAMLNSHVDRLPLVFSAVINVAQDVDQPWPMELIAHGGKAHNITMKPGEMLLYESHSVIHGRPFEMEGRFVANLFVHFEPAGHSLKHHNHDESSGQSTTMQYRDAIEQGKGGHEAEGNANGLPPYLLQNSPEESNFREEHSDLFPSARKTQTLAHLLASEGRTNELIELIEEQKHLIHATDSNGWTPLHEGARWGHVDVVKFLVEQGADIRLRSKNGTGGNAMFYAQAEQGSEAPVVLFLQSLGARSVEPDAEL